MKKNKDKTKIAITGHLGYLGQYLLQKLVSIYSNINIYTYDVVSGKNILNDEIFKSDYIFHLAAQTSVQESFNDPMYDAITNILGTIKILKENPKSKILITCSAASKDPKSPYGISKLAQSLYAQIIHSNAVVLILPNIYGEGGHGVVETFLKSPIVRVNGDGKQVRDFVHVNDIVAALIRAMDWKPGVYELGSGEGTTILALAKATGKEIKHMPALEGEIRESVLKNEAPDGWKPAINVVEYIKQTALNG